MEIILAALARAFLVNLVSREVSPPPPAPVLPSSAELHRRLDALRRSVVLSRVQQARARAGLA
jgi:hypothetical protein